MRIASAAPVLALVLVTLVAGAAHADAQTQWETVTLDLSGGVGQGYGWDSVRFETTDGQPRPVKVVATPESPYTLPEGIGTPYPAPLRGLCSVADDCKSDIEMVFPEGVRNLQFTIVGGGYSPGSNYCRNGHADVVIQGDYPHVSIRSIFIYGIWALPVFGDLGSADIKYVRVPISESMRLCGLGAHPVLGFRRGMAIGSISFERRRPGPPIEVIDPACITPTSCNGDFVSDDGIGNLVNDPALLIAAPVHRRAAVADGVTRLLLRTRSDVGMGFSIEVPAGQAKGRVLTRTGVPLSASEVVPPEPINGTNWVLAIYEVPTDLLPSIVSVMATIVGETTDGRTSQTQIQLVRPPPLLVHGVWSNGGAWKDLAVYLKAAGYPDCWECVVDYGSLEGGKAPSFHPSLPSVALTEIKNRVQWVLGKLHREGTAASQVDVVAHSMGGLVARARAAQVFTYRSRANYFKGEFHKIITVGTPHLGTPLADWMVANRCTTGQICLNGAAGTLPVCVPITLEQLFALPLVEKPIGPAIFGFQTSGAPIDSLGATYVPSHAIVGIAPDLSTIEMGLNLLARMFGSPLTIDDMLATPTTRGKHDTIVPQLSQRGGLATPAISEIAGIVHAIGSPNETDSGAVFAEVLRLLQAPTISAEFGSFPARRSTSSVPPSGSVCPAAARLHSSLASAGTPSLALQASAAPSSLLMTPLPGTVVRPGDTVSVTFTIAGGGPIEEVMFRMGQELRVSGGAEPLSVSYTVPADRAGRIDVSALAIGTDGRNYLGTTFITVAAAAPVQQFAITPAAVSFRRLGDRTVLQVIGSYLDGMILDVTSGTAGTTYATLSGTADVISVSPDGVVEARGPGDEVVVVTHGGLTQQVPIAVRITNRAPVLAAIDSLTVAVGASATINLSASDPDGNDLKFFVSGLPLSTTLVDHGNRTGQLTFMPGRLDVGTHEIAVTVVDSGDPVEESSHVFTVTVPPPAPGTAPPNPIAYVPIRNSSTLARFDTATGQVLGAIDLVSFCSQNGNDPVRVGIDPAGFRAFVLNPICHGIDVVNLKTGRRLEGGSILAIDTEGYPSSIVFDRHGRYAYVGSQRSRHGNNDTPGFVEVLNVRRLSVEATIDVGGVPRGIALHPNGSVLYAAVSPNRVTVVDLNTRAVVSTITLPVSSPGGIAISPDGSRAFVTTSGSPALVVLDTGTRTVITSIPLPSAPTAIAAHPRASRVYVRHQTGVMVFSTATLQVLETIASPADALDSPLAFTPDGTTLLARGAGDTINLHNLSDGSTTPVALPGVPGWPAIAPACTYETSEPVYTLAPGGGTLRVSVSAPAGCGWTVSNDAPWLTVVTAAGTGDGVVEVQAAANAGVSRKARLSISGESLSVVQSAPQPLYGFVPTSRELGWHQRSYGPALAVLDMDAEEVVAYLPGLPFELSVLNAPGGMAAAADANRLFFGPGAMVDTGTLQVIEDPRATGGNRGIAISPDGRLIASIQRDDLVWVNDAATNRTIWTLPVDRTSPLIALGFVGDGQTLFVLREDSTVLVLDMAQRAFTGSFKPAADFTNFTISTDRRQLFGRTGGNEAPEILIVDVATQVVTRRLAIPAFAGDMVVNPQATYAYVEYGDDVVRVNLATGATTTWRHTFTVVTLSLDPSGQRLYLANLELNSVSVMDANTGAIVGSIGMNPGNYPTRAVVGHIAAAPVACQYNFRHFGYFEQAGRTGVVDIVPTISGCGEWRATSEASWITLSGPTSGTGHHALSFRVHPNSGTARSGSVDINGRKFRFRQAGTAEPLIVTSVVPSAGPATGHSWVTITGSGFNAPFGVSIGHGVRAFHVVDSNTLEALTAPGTVNTTVNVSILEVNRFGSLQNAYSYTPTGAPPCTPAVGAAGVVPAAGGPLDLSVTAPAGCKWPAASAVSWIQIPGGGGTGTAAAHLVVAANTGQARRSGDVHVAGHVLQITQAGLGEGPGCTPTLSTTEAVTSGLGGTVPVDVVASADCQWGITSRVPWITIDGSAVRTGAGRVTVIVAINPTSAPRIGVVDAGGHTFTITQAASQADSSFGNGGKVTFDFGGSTARANAVALQPDGKLVVVGQTRSTADPSTGDFAIARLNADGTLDGTFGSGGRITTDFFGLEDAANAVVLQPDGKIVVAGFSSDASGKGLAVARYLTDGQADSSFGTSGSVRTAGANPIVFDFFGCYTERVLEATAVALQPDGRIVAVGNAYDGYLLSSHDIAVVRYMPDGSPDATLTANGPCPAFAGAGVRVIDIHETAGAPPFFDDFARSVVLQPDGKIVIGGSTLLLISNQSNQDDFLLLRLNANGTPDPTFGTGGVAVTDMDDGLGGLDYLQGVALQADGHIVSAGGAEHIWNGAQFFSTFSLTRHTPAGALDQGFGAGGRVQTILNYEAPFAFSEGAVGVAIEAGGRIVVAGDTVTRFGAPSDFRIGRYTPTGGVDAVFAGNGYVTTDFFGRDDHAHALALQTDGRIVVVGSASVSDASSVFAIARYPGGGTCAYSASLGVSLFAATLSSGSVEVTTTAGCEWTATSSVPWLTMTSSTGTGSGRATFTVAANAGADARSGTVTVAGQQLTVTQAGKPTMSLGRSALTFAATSTGAGFVAQTGNQSVQLLQHGTAAVGWTATATHPWITVSPASGTGSRTLTVGVTFTTGLPVTGRSAGAIVLAFNGASDTAGTIAITLDTMANGAATAPIGAMDTPDDGATGVTGSIGITGWAIDDLEVRQVRILRDPVPGEGAAQVFIGNGTFVEDARPDIARLQPNAPRNVRAGWGYLMLTNFLPNQGNGTFKLYAYADDFDGHTTLLGTRTITCANSTSTKPFGAIDTPDQGELIGGANYANFGWVLARGPARAHPPFGTVRVLVDGVFMPVPPGGWVGRTDLAAAFPAATYPAVGNALGVATLDTTQLTNGVHTIAWVVTADNGESAGIGSRYFSVANGTSAAVLSPLVIVDPDTTRAVFQRVLARDAQSRAVTMSAADVNALPADLPGLKARRGYDATAPLRVHAVDADGRATIQGEELDRLELHLGVDVRAGYLRVGGELHPLPIGSHLDPQTGIFTWAPGPGFVRDYDLVFVASSHGQATARREVRIVLNPKRSNRTGPQVALDAVPRGADHAQSFVVSGWAFDADATTSTGIDRVHVWAHPAGGGAPVFVGAASYGTAREDAAAIFGRRFRESGFALTVQSLPPGSYDVSVLAWSVAMGEFVRSTPLRVTVR